ncbi:polysaccharide pyruvyl transferase family protein [Photobacterium damselae subsp. damselae]|uniref:polysaccharide pyruvyl transferase family protein n=1 Tax=Photobacterium damselae TaxID=38293 RepID=UPI00083AC42C|nr:polysaccharide pyruvyl transferase family protein [Photobacterium damselae]QSH58005.1 polysaccharide pyruvyl transferase family protein [Photobacterium damselae subsp. damselae]
MKVLIVNRGLCDNIGDQAINVAMHAFIEKNFNANCFFSDFTSTNKNILKIRNDGECKYSKYKRLLKKILPLDLIWIFRNINRIKNNIIDSDLIVIGGGQLILSNRFAIALFVWVYLSRRYNKKVLVSCVGSGTKFSFLKKKYIKYGLSRVEHISVRDIESQKVLKQEFNVDSEVTGDIVFTRFLKQKKNRELLLLGVTELSVYNLYNKPLSRENYYIKWIKLVEKSKYLLSDFKLVYTTQNDYYECLYFRNFVINKFNLELDIVDTSTLNNFNNILNNSKFIIAGRMHALILGLINGCDIMPFPISDKLISFTKIIKKSNLDDYRQSIIEKQIKIFHSYIKKEE